MNWFVGCYVWLACAYTINLVVALLIVLLLIVILRFGVGLMLCGGWVGWLVGRLGLTSVTCFVACGLLVFAGWCVWVRLPCTCLGEQCC